MKKQQWLLGICLLTFVLLLVGASLLYGTLSEQNEIDNLVTLETTAAPVTDTNSAAVPQSTATAAPSNMSAPDFTVTDRDGNAVRLSDFSGKPVILNFWASWCGPCKSEMPEFEEAYHRYGEEIAFLLVNVTDGSSETVTSATSYIDGQGYTFPIYFDTTLEASILYGASAIPLTYFIDANGNLVARAAGALSADKLQKGIDMILEK